MVKFEKGSDTVLAQVWMGPRRTRGPISIDGKPYYQNDIDEEGEGTSEVKGEKRPRRARTRAYSEPSLCQRFTRGERHRQPKPKQTRGARALSARQKRELDPAGRYHRPRATCVHAKRSGICGSRGVGFF